jgi:hypothetical protein
MGMTHIHLGVDEKTIDYFGAAPATCREQIAQSLSPVTGIEAN